MKRCSECRRDYYDDTLLYCLDDGNALLEGPASVDEPATAILSTAEAKTEILSADFNKSNSIAVLPFTHMSSEEDNEYFCDGLAEELLNALSKIEDLKVAARTSAFSFKGKNANISEIGEKLSVKHVLEGSVRKSGSKLRISVQLVNAADGYQLWSERYDREMADIFDIQDEITLAVVDALKIKLLGHAKAEIFERKTISTEALDFYLKGRFHFQQHTPAGFNNAIEYFQQAIELEPNYALAFAGLSSVLIFQWFFGFVSADEAIPKAKNVALRALDLNFNLDEAHIALAHIRMFYERDLKSAEQEYGEAIRLNSNNAYARYQYGLCLAVLGKREQAIVEAEKAIELEPLSVMANFQVAAIYYHLGLFEESARYSQRLIEMAAGFYGGYLLKGGVFSAQGDFVEAIRLLEKALTLDKSQGFTKSLLGQTYGLAGNHIKASELIEGLENERAKSYVNAFDIARIYSSLRDVDKTVEWLGKAVEEQNGELVYLKLYANKSGGDILGRSVALGQAISRFTASYKFVNR